MAIPVTTKLTPIIATQTITLMIVSSRTSNAGTLGSSRTVTNTTFGFGTISRSFFIYILLKNPGDGTHQTREFS